MDAVLKIIRHVVDIMAMFSKEMVIDKHEDRSFPRYLIYDIIKFRGEDVGKTEFRTRLLCIEVGFCFTAFDSIVFRIYFVN